MCACVCIREVEARRKADPPHRTTQWDGFVSHITHASMSARTPDRDGAEVVEDGVPHRGQEVRHLLLLHTRVFYVLHVNRNAL